MAGHKACWYIIILQNTILHLLKHANVAPKPLVVKFKYFWKTLYIIEDSKVYIFYIIDIWFKIFYLLLKYYHVKGADIGFGHYAKRPSRYTLSYLFTYWYLMSAILLFIRHCNASMLFSLCICWIGWRSYLPLAKYLLPTTLLPLNTANLMPLHYAHHYKIIHTKVATHTQFIDSQ